MLKFDIFFSKLQMGGSWTTSQPALGFLVTSSVLPSFPHLSLPRAGFPGSHGLCWAGYWMCWIGASTKPIFCVCSAEPSHQHIPWHTCTQCSSPSSCVLMLPQPALAGLPYPPSSTCNRLTFHTAPPNAYSQLVPMLKVPQSTGTFQGRLPQPSEITILLGK